MATNVSENSHIQARYNQPIGAGLYLFDSLFNGQIYIHIRKLLDGTKPTKDGITLNLQRCNELFISLPFLEDAVRTMESNQDTFYRRHLGGNWHVTVQNGFNCVDIRQFWFPEGCSEIQATRKGISLTFEQFKELRNGLRIIDIFVPELRDVKPCYCENNHDAAQCVECTPALKNISRKTVSKDTLEYLK